MALNKESLPIFRRIEDLERLAVLEVRVNDHEEDLKQLLVHQEVLSKGLAGINATLRKILYVCIGAGAMIAVQQEGLIGVLVKFVT
jgi:hypothetical protein